jgi:hypothetical protein
VKLLMVSLHAKTLVIRICFCYNRGIGIIRDTIIDIQEVMRINCYGKENLDTFIYSECVVSFF